MSIISITTWLYKYEKSYIYTAVEERNIEANLPVMNTI